MGRKLVFLNILMLAALLVVAQNLVGNWREFEIGQKPIQPVGSDVQLQEASMPERPASLSLFLDIGARNLFSEQRGQDPGEELEDAGEAPPELEPEPTLTSVITFGGTKKAVLAIASNRRKRKPADVRRVELGDDVLGYTVAEIEDDHIVLSWREHRREIFLDPKQAKPKKTARAAGGPRIIVVGAPAAAVGQTTLAAAVEEGRGVQVGSVGQVAQGGGRGGGLGGAGGGLAGGRGGSGVGGGRGGGLGGARNSGGGGLSGASGIVGGGRSTGGRSTQQRRPPGD